MMRPFALVLLLPLLALAAPAASGLAAEVALEEIPAPPPAPVDVVDATEPLPSAPLPPPPHLPVRADVEVDVGPIGKTGLAFGDSGGSGPQPAAIPETIARAAPPALAAAGFLALLQAFGGFRALGLGAFALYSRLAKSELLDNEHRDKVFRLVRETPGLALTEIMRRSGLGWGTTVYHLDRLERAQMVTSERAGLHRCYFPMGAVPRAARKGMGALKADTTRSVAAFLVERPGVSQTDLCEGLGLSASAASKQVTKLESAGLVRRERDGKSVRLYPEEGLSPLLAEDGALAGVPLGGAAAVRAPAAA